MATLVIKGSAFFVFFNGTRLLAIVFDCLTAFGAILVLTDEARFGLEFETIRIALLAELRLTGCFLVESITGFDCDLLCFGVCLGVVDLRSGVARRLLMAGFKGDKKPLLLTISFRYLFSSCRNWTCSYTVAKDCLEL